MRWSPGLVVCALAVACSHPGPATPSPPPLPEGGAPNGPGEGAQGWSFEHGLDGWSVQQGAVAPVCEPVNADRLRTAAGAPVVSLSPPGDYWRTPIDVGMHGRCRIDTGAVARSAAALLSPDFVLDKPYVVFRMGGGGSPGTRVELQLAEQSYAPFVSEPGTPALAMREVVWDVRSLQGKAARFAILDDGQAGPGILADAFHASTEARARPAPLWGFADLHAHPVSQLGFGKHLFYGKNDGPIEQALAPCDAEHGAHGAGGRAGPLMAFFEPSFDGHPGHDTNGFPKLEGWPRFTSRGHQQMYIEWIRRAWQGGLRLLVAHAVNNEELATVFRGQAPFDDVAVAIAALDELSALASRHSDFMAVALTPKEAREIIGSGRLALVLGVELDALGKCRQDADCNEAQMRAAVLELYTHGARHVFPIHLTDNAFGGAAVFQDGLFNQLSWFLRDEFQKVEHSDAVAFSLNDAPQGLTEWIARVPLLENLYGHVRLYPHYGHIPAGHINQRGLTPLGKALVSELMQKGILIDIDHMSQKARSETLALAKEREVALAMGHAWFRELAYTREQTDDSEKLKHEGMQSAEDIEALRALGGVVAPMLNQGDIRRDAGSGIQSECAGSSSSWLQAYSYAVQRFGGSGSGASGSGVGVGTDVNGFAQGTTPRFGPLACLARAKHTGSEDGRRRAPGLSMNQTLRADADSQDAGVTYATPLRKAFKSRFLHAAKSKPYDPDEVTLWIALAASSSGQAANALGLDLGEQLVVKDVLLGLADSALHPGASWRSAAFLVKSAVPAPTTPALLRQRYELFLPIFQQWKKSDSGNASAPLERNLAGDRDFDYNLDGLAHYGLLPDFLQDSANQLRRANGSVKDLSSLFRSAEGYVRAWERGSGGAGP